MFVSGVVCRVGVQVAVVRLEVQQASWGPIEGVLPSLSRVGIELLRRSIPRQLQRMELRLSWTRDADVSRSAQRVVSSPDCVRADCPYLRRDNGLRRIENPFRNGSFLLFAAGGLLLGSEAVGAVEVPPFSRALSNVHVVSEEEIAILSALLPSHFSTNWELASNLPGDPYYVPPESDLDCWVDERFSYASCCNTMYAVNDRNDQLNSLCWSSEFTRQRCCPAVRSTNVSVATQGSLESTGRGGGGAASREKLTPTGYRALFHPSSCLELVKYFDFAQLQSWRMLDKDFLRACAADEDVDACNRLDPVADAYTRCLRLLQRGYINEMEKEKQVSVQGVHWPTVVTTHFELTFLSPAFDMYVGNSLASTGTWNERELFFMQFFLRKDAVFVDAGANIGGFTVPIAKYLRGNGIKTDAAATCGTVHSFEPFRHLFQTLTANVAINGLANVFTHNVGLSDVGVRGGARQKRFEKVYVPELNQFSNPSKSHIVDVESETLVRRSGAEEHIRLATLDEVLLGAEAGEEASSFAAANAVSRVDFIKIDVESMELLVLRGSAEVLRRFRPLLFVEDSQNVPDAISVLAELCQGDFLETGTTCALSPNKETLEQLELEYGHSKAHLSPILAAPTTKVVRHLYREGYLCLDLSRWFTCYLCAPRERFIATRTRVEYFFLVHGE